MASMQLADVKPWGRSLHEYRLMFSLSDSDLGQRVLGCGDGPARVNAELQAFGKRNLFILKIWIISFSEKEGGRALLRPAPQQISPQLIFSRLMC
jgi:hypothetical protein